MATLVNLAYWVFGFSKLAHYAEPPTSTHDHSDEVPVSVVICAHNEAHNLQKNLPHILNQNYRSFEIVVVNDASTDTTARVLLDFQKKNPYLRIISITNKKKNHIGKKYALTQGILASRYETLLLTDADCRPASRHWIRKMQAGIRGDIEIGLGYGPYNKADGLLNKFIHYETIYTAIQYFSFALHKQAYMGVGRNLIYQKRLFVAAQGFGAHQHIASGDDDLFVTAVARPQNVRVILDKDTFMYSEAKQTWKAYFRQKVRHLSTASAYRPRHQLLLGILSATHFAHYVGFFCLILHFSIIFAGVIYMVRILVLLYFYKRILRKLDSSFLWAWIPILDIMFVLYYIIFLPSLFTSKNNRWT